MADKKKPRGDRKQTEPEKDRHAPHTMVRLPPDLHRQLKALAERHHRPLAWQLRLLIEQALAAEGLWPPPDVPPQD